MALSAKVTRLQAWVLAARPKTLTAAVAPVLVGTGLAAHDGALAILPAAAALLGAVLIQIGTNLANDYYDFVRGADTEDRVGPIRVTQAGLLSPASVRNAMAGVLTSAVFVGVYLVAIGGWPIVWIGVASVACAVLYTGGPFPLAYHGLGDVFVFVFFGLVAVGGTYFVQALSWSSDVLLAGADVRAAYSLFEICMFCFFSCKKLTLQRDYRHGGFWPPPRRALGRCRYACCL